MANSWQYIFMNRQDAGKQLGEYLLKRNYEKPVVLALPRGGIPVGDEVSQVLSSPFDVVVARKIGAPMQPEFGIGALSENEIPIFNPSILKYFNVSGEEVMETVASEILELRRRMTQYRQGRELELVTGRTVILVDDGIATGVTAAAAGKFLRTLKPKEIIMAVPVGPVEIDEFVSDQFDEIITLYRPLNFSAVGLWYEDFRQVDDHEVLNILEKYYPTRYYASPQ